MGEDFAPFSTTLHHFSTPWLYYNIYLIDFQVPGICFHKIFTFCSYYFGHNIPVAHIEKSHFRLNCPNIIPFFSTFAHTSLPAEKAGGKVVEKTPKRRPTSP
jgi:hypothetical protein